MIPNDEQLKTTQDRIAWLQQQIAQLRRTDTKPANYHAASRGFLAEVDRMQLEVREYLSLHPSEVAGAA